MRRALLRRAAIVAVTLAVTLLTPLVAEAQQPPQCRPTVQLESQLRRVTGSVMAECTGIHTKPFGNWGVNTNLPSSRNNRDQFRGWLGSTTSVKGQWNSCTDWYPTRTNDGYRKQKAYPDDDRISGWRPYQRSDTWEQCEGFVPEVHSVNNVKLELYELDAPCCDQKITILGYGSFDIEISCSDPWTCDGASEWRVQDSVDNTGVTARVRAVYKARSVPTY